MKPNEIINIYRQANCSKGIPNNTLVEGWVLVSTPGNGAELGDLLFDNGSNVGKMAIAPAKEGRIINAPTKFEREFELTEHKEESKC